MPVAELYLGKETMLYVFEFLFNMEVGEMNY